MNIEGIPNPKRRKTPKVFLPQIYKMAVIGLDFPCFGKKTQKNPDRIFKGGRDGNANVLGCQRLCLKGAIHHGRLADPLEPLNGFSLTF